jgi:hypothetical protein
MPLDLDQHLGATQQGAVSRDGVATVAVGLGLLRDSHQCVGGSADAVEQGGAVREGGGFGSGDRRAYQALRYVVLEMALNSIAMQTVAARDGARRLAGQERMIDRLAIGMSADRAGARHGSMCNQLQIGLNRRHGDQIDERG